MCKNAAIQLPDQNEPFGKKAYSTPNLIVYGEVRTLTQSTSVGGLENTHGSEGMSSGSDRAVKENIVQIGTHPMGIGLYLFDYKSDYPELSGRGRQFGVMADEVEAILPAAVGRHSNGYKTVDYSLLGISRRTQ